MTSTSVVAPPVLLRTCSPPSPPSSACTSRCSASRTRGGSLLSPHHTAPPAWCLQDWRPVLGRKSEDLNRFCITNRVTNIAGPYFCHQVSRQEQWSPFRCIHWAVGSRHAENLPSGAVAATECRQYNYPPIKNAWIHYRENDLSRPLQLCWPEQWDPFWGTMPYTVRGLEAASLPPAGRLAWLWLQGITLEQVNGLETISLATGMHWPWL